MSNALGIGPAVMINRMVHEAGRAGATHLAEVARLRMELEAAAQAEKAREGLLNPTTQATAPIVDSGAVVDRLI